MATKPPKTTVVAKTKTLANGQALSTLNKSWTNYYTVNDKGSPNVRADNLHNRDMRLLRSLVMIPSKYGNYYTIPYPDNAFDYLIGNDFTATDNRAYGRFRKTLYEGNANVGVTLGSLKQTLSMVHGKTIGLARALDQANRRILKDRELRKKIQSRGLLARDVLSTWSASGSVIGTTVHRRIQGGRASQLINPGWTLPTRAGRFTKGTANQFLEYKFGWVPLFEDLHNLLFTVMPQAVPDSRITSSASTWKEKSNVSNGPYQRTTESALFKFRTKYIAHVAIDNPNVWLANRAGLINLPAVAWDLIPWSWVVGMFGNFTQMLNSVTDFYGLRITSQFLLHHYHGTVVRLDQNGQYTGPTDPMVGAQSEARWILDKKTVVTGVPLRPSFQMRIPEANADLLLTAAALVTQRMGKISKLFR